MAMPESNSVLYKKERFIYILCEVKSISFAITLCAHREELHCIEQTLIVITSIIFGCIIK